MTQETLRRTRLLLIRHGQADSKGRFLQHACEGLTPLGMDQAKALASRLLLDESLTDAVIVSSKARRAIETAETVASTLGKNLAEPTCDLCEMHPGEAEGLTYEEMKARFGPTYEDVPGAEYFPDWVPAVGDAIERLATTYRGRPIIAVTHNGVVQASFAVLGGMTVSGREIVCPYNTAITEWSRESDVESGGTWSLDRFNDAAHIGQK